MKKNITIDSRILSLTAALAVAFIQPSVQATPYASGVSVNSGTVSFYINESGGTVVVTYEDGSTNSSFDGQVTGTNLPSGQYSFNLNSHTSYNIAVTKAGAGIGGMLPNVIQHTNTSVYGNNFVLFGCGSPRGVAVNVNQTSPYFGRIYVTRGGNSTNAPNIPNLFDLNSDGSFSTAGPGGSQAGVTTWVSNDFHVVSPDRISVAPNDLLVVGDWSIANAGVWLIDPNLVTNELLLGPIGMGSPTIHAGEEGRPILLGSLDTGATLLTIDSDTPSSAPGSILAYSNITSAAIASGSGWQNPPDFAGPQVTLNYNQNIGQGFYFCPSLSVDPNTGNVFSGEYRGGVSAGDKAAVQVYDPTLHNQLWNSRYNGGSSDYFYTAASGGSACNPSDLAVSPDGKYLAVAGVDNHLTICLLTNGIPDVSSIYTIAPDRFDSVGSYALATEVAWDAADNIYTLSANNYGLKVFTLGLSSKAITSGNASGNTGFSMAFLNTTITAYATNNPVISQANSYGNPTSGSFTLVRTGADVSGPLTVNFTLGGTATNGTYTASNTTTVVFAPGQTVTNITVTAVTDNKPRLTTTVVLTLQPSGTYSVVGQGRATISILNTATPYLIASTGVPTMYNAFSNDYASMVITRWGDTNATTTVSSYTASGTASMGTDFTTPTTVTFNPGDLTKTTYVSPLVGGALPVHSSSLPFTGNKTFVLGIAAGGGYVAATNTATLKIIDSALPPENVLFADPLTDPNDATNWGITAANGNIANVPTDIDPEFGYDLAANTFPYPPNGSTHALRITVNKLSGQGGTAPMTAINAYMTNRAFSGNYAVRFNMNVIETGNLIESGSFNNEEGALFGINHNGMETNWFAADSFAVGAPNSWSADGIFFWVSDSGGRYDNFFTPYEGFVGNGSPTTNTGWAFISSQGTAPFANAFKTNVFTSQSSSFLPPNDGGWTEGGPGLTANGSASYGLSETSWSDVEIRQLNGVVTMSIDKTPIIVYTNTSMFTGGYLMLGYEDPYNGGEDAATAVYYSNLRVVSIGGPMITNVGLDNVHGNVVMNFNVTDDSGNFTVQGASNVKGPYSTIPSATVTPLGGGAFQVIAPKNGAIQFYRVLQQ